MRTVSSLSSPLLGCNLVQVPSIVCTEPIHQSKINKLPPSKMLGLDIKLPQWLKFEWVYMDYEGQKVAERLYQRIILFFAAVGFVAGYALQQFSYTVGALGVGSVVAALVCGIPWGSYRKHPLKWQPVVKEDEPAEGTSAPAKSSAEGKKKKKK
ncbi:hypothetical protein BV898_02216 [Hypsibius exemplaris]|uniref:Signal peptidase complex subunit 1 n=1 Tax=Hypsibius exemplaris TaxID=2072580 RepID=A0A1W0X8M0_HYPEX|nr:hypothetical protein BV898_02216 [Hypsibius exemplaris]